LTALTTPGVRNDDYLVKPFSNRALLAAVRAALAEHRHRERMRDRLRVGDPPTACYSDLHDLGHLRAGSSGGRGRPPRNHGRRACIPQPAGVCSPACLADHPHRTVGYKVLWRGVWGYDSLPDKRVVRKAMSRLRKKVGGEKTA